jgi:hypothetical protein
MVAGLAADVFVQLTATLAHLSSTLNKTDKAGGAIGPGGFRLPPLPQGSGQYDMYGNSQRGKSKRLRGI